ncbi:MAG: efflux RND transporter periplasmic adaptor subunit [Bacteroidota bacterium]
MKINIISTILAFVIGGALVWFVKPSTDTIEHESSKLSPEISNDQAVYTCSMHPQIRQNEFGICPICEMDLTPLAANTSNDPLVLEMTEAAVQLANIQTTLIGENMQSSEAILRLSGKVQADERLASSQVAHLAGRIEKLHVSFEGEVVRKGQKLADLYSPELIAAQRELLEAKKLIELNPNLLAAARSKLKYWKIGEAAIQTIETSGEIQETFPLYAQESGVVTKRKVAVGDHLEAGEVLFELMNLRKVWVLFDAYEEDLANINIGSTIEFTTPALPNQTFKSRVTFVDPIIDPNTRTASIRVEVNNTNRQLKPEMLVYGKLTTKNDKQTQLIVPKTAVLWTGKRSVVYVKVPDTKVPAFQYREVELGVAMGDNYQIMSGLEAGEAVVTYGSFTIDAAAQLNNQVSMMNQNINIKGEDSDAIPDYRATTPEDFQQQLAALTDAYLPLKDAFVQTDDGAAAVAAKNFVQVLEKVDGNLLSKAAQLYWSAQQNNMQAHVKKIELATEIEVQRQQFEFLSIAMIDAVTAFGTSKVSLYVQHCPMAFDNRGADWLAIEEGIRNPYFGDLMMKCGFVKAVLDGNEN